MFEFLAVSPSDRTVLERWLTEPRVARWFDEPDYVETIYGQLSDPAIRPMIVWHHGVRVAYLQDYRVHAWADHPLGFLPEGARGVDTFVGEASAMGRGLGPAYLRAFAARSWAEGVPALGIDPHPENLAAIRAYEKAGFRGDEVRETTLGLARLMVLWPGGV